MSLQPRTGKTTSPLSYTFSLPQNDKIHGLTPGHSMLLGYPGSAYEHGVFLLALIAHDTAEYMAFQLNGPAQTSLHKVMHDVLGVEQPRCLDMPVCGGGSTENMRMFILTELDWHPEITSFESGEYRVHATSTALELIERGEGPRQMLPVLGYVQGPISGLQAALTDNQIGEIAADPQLVYGALNPHQKWRKALDIHTGGNPLFIPVAPPVSHLPCDDPKEARLLMN